MGSDTARRVIPLFRPYRGRVAAVVGLIVLTSTIGIVNPLLIQAVFNKALFPPGGPNLELLYILVGIMAAVPIVNGAIGILQTYETTKVGQHVMRDLRDQLYSHLETLSLAFFTGTKTGEIQSRLANDVGGVQTVVTTTASTAPTTSSPRCTVPTLTCASASTTWSRRRTGSRSGGPCTAPTPVPCSDGRRPASRSSSPPS